MIGYILGNYLVDAGKITKEQLREVIDGAGKVRVKLGLIAVAEGYMTAAETEEVNRLQAVMDKRFGDIAVESGYLTDEQVDIILKKQGDEYMVFLQTLVDMNIMCMADAEKLFAEFCSAKGLDEAQCEDIKSGDIDRILSVYLPKAGESYKDIMGVALRTIIRCVDREVCLGQGVMVDSINGKKGSFQTVEAEDGSITCVGLVEDDGGFLLSASLFAGEEFATLDEDALDSCAELLNCINGIYASAKSKEDMELELLPPVMYMEDVELKGNNICVLPVMVKGKKMSFVIFE